MQHESIHVRVTSNFPESVCLSSLRDTIDRLKGEPQKIRNHYFKNIFFGKLLTKVTMVQIYDSPQLLFLILLVRRKSPSYFGLKGIIGKCDYKFSCFRHISYLLILMQPSKHKIIRCSENEVEPEVLHSSVNKYTSYKSYTQQRWNRKILGRSCFQHFATYMFIEY